MAVVYDKLLDKELLHTHPAGSGSLGGLTDVDITSPANDDLLQYNSATSKWKNKRKMLYDTDYKAYLIIEY